MAIKVFAAIGIMFTLSVLATLCYIIIAEVIDQQKRDYVLRNRR